MSSGAQCGKKCTLCPLDPGARGKEVCSRCEVINTPTAAGDLAAWHHRRYGVAGIVCKGLGRMATCTYMVWRGGGRAESRGEAGVL